MFSTVNQMYFDEYFLFKIMYFFKLCVYIIIFQFGSIELSNFKKTFFC